MAVAVVVFSVTVIMVEEIEDLTRVMSGIILGSILTESGALGNKGSIDDLRLQV